MIIATQTLVLKKLAEAPRTLSSLAGHFDGSSRRQVVKTVGKLMQKKLVAYVRRRSGGFGSRQEEPVYGVTPEGDAFARSGKTITSGPNGKFAGPRKPGAETLRSRLWRAFRIQRKATIPQLVEVARNAADAVDVNSNALRYLNALCRAGVAAKLPTREKGHALTSNGFVRFALIRDLGPVAPVAAAAHLIDHNPNAPEKFIAYREVSK